VRGNEESGLAAFDIDEEDPERAFRSLYVTAEKEGAERDRKSSHARDRTRREHGLPV
jgi:hypothetical protein